MNAGQTGWSAAEVDACLAGWRTRLSTVAQNLFDLQADPTYRMLTGGGVGSSSPVSGATAARVGAALGAMHTIFEHFDRLQTTIDRAAALRSGRAALFGGEARLAEAEKLLRGRTIRMPAVPVPLEQRHLLSGIDGVECVSADELLSTMASAFAAARDAVLAVDRTLKELARVVERTEDEFAALQAHGERARMGPELELAAGEFETIRTRMLADPIGALAGLGARVEPALRRARAAVADRDALFSRLAAARSSQRTLRKAHADAEAARHQACERVAGPLPEVVPWAKLEALADWLGRLEARCAGEATAPLEVGVRNWMRAADECAQQDAAALHAASAALASREELRGRLESLKAKARAYGVAEQPGIVALAEGAAEHLRAHPAQLPRVADSVARFERALTQAGRAERV